MQHRAYDGDKKDYEAIKRIWLETGWLEDADNTKCLDAALDGGRTIVADVNGEPECCVMRSPATLRHGETDLSMCAVTGVTTSHIARKQGLAGRLTARAIADDAADGALTSGLGMFEQGYYDRLGFGLTGYARIFAFDPSALRVPNAKRPPIRLTIDDVAEMQKNRLARRMTHGGVNILDEHHTRAAAEYAKKCFGLGYRDESGELTHHMWITNDGEAEKGPYQVLWWSWRTREQLHELLGVLRNFGDQIPLIKVNEPGGVQLQPLVKKPFRHRHISKGGSFDSQAMSVAWSQYRINDVPGCLAKTELPTDRTVEFTLELTDPIESFLEDYDCSWKGCAGTYRVSIGAQCEAEKKDDASLPRMRTSVNTFTRMWLGVLPPTGLVLTDEIDCPPELLRELDDVLRLPSPVADWDF